MIYFMYFVKMNMKNRCALSQTELLIENMELFFNIYTLNMPMLLWACFYEFTINQDILDAALRNQEVVEWGSLFQYIGFRLH